MIDQDLLSELQRVLLEPIVDGGQTWASEIWTRQEVLDALNDATGELVRDTQLVVKRVEISVLANATSVPLPADWLVTASVVWRDGTTGLRTPLGPADSFEADCALPTWETTTGTPIAVADLDSTTLIFRLVPTPNVAGVVELLYIPRPAAISGSGTTLPIPDEFVSAEKYGALETLLGKVGRLQDPARAAYCAQRVQIATIAAEVLLRGWA